MHFGTFGLLTAVMGRKGENVLSFEYLQIENHSPQIMLEARNTEYSKESVCVSGQRECCAESMGQYGNVLQLHFAGDKVSGVYERLCSILAMNSPN